MATVLFVVTFGVAILPGVRAGDFYITDIIARSLYHLGIFAGPYSGILAVCVLFSVIFAFYKEPKGHIRTKIANIMFIMSMLLGTAWILLLDTISFGMREVFPYLLLFPVVLGIGLYLNYKFQKNNE